MRRTCSLDTSPWEIQGVEENARKYGYGTYTKLEPDAYSFWNHISWKNGTSTTKWGYSFWDSKIANWFQYMEEEEAQELMLNEEAQA